MGRWRLIYEETHVEVALPPRRRGPGPLKRLIWAILGLAGGCAVMWFLVRGLPAGEWDRFKQSPMGEAQRVGGAIVSQMPRATDEETPSEYPPGGPESPRAAQSGEESPAAARELEFMEIARAGVRMGDDSPVFQWPDASSIAVSHVSSGKYVLVRGTTPNFLQVQLEGGVIGYVPFDVANVMEMEHWKRCYSVQPQSPLLKNPNAHSDKVGDTGDGAQALGEGEGLGEYPFIRMPDGAEGYVLGAQVLAQVECEQ